MVFSGYLIIEQRLLIIIDVISLKSLLKRFLSLYSKSKKNAKNFQGNLI